MVDELKDAACAVASTANSRNHFILILGSIVSSCDKYHRRLLMRTCLTMRVFWPLFACIWSVAYAMTIVSEISTVQIINSQQFEMTTMTAELGPGDENVPQVLTIEDTASGNVYTVTINSPAPEYVYTRILKGWIPAFQQCVVNDVPLLVSNIPPNSGTIGYPVVGGATNPAPNLQTTYHLAKKPSPRSHKMSLLSTRRSTEGDVAGAVVVSGLALALGGGGFVSCFGANMAFGLLCHVGDFGSLFSCGGGGNYQASIDELNSRVDNLVNETDMLANQIQQQQIWENSATHNIDMLFADNNLVQSQLNNVEIALRQQALELGTLEQVTQSMQQHFTNAFSNLTQAFNAEVLQEQELYNYTVALARLTNQQIQSILVELNAIDITLSQVSMFVDAVYKKIIARRTLIVAFWNNSVNIPLPLPTCAFVQCMGFPPLANPTNANYEYANAANCPVQSADCLTNLNAVPGTNLFASAQTGAATDIQTLRSLPYAAQLAVVRLQYTTSGSPALAVERQLSYVCDKIYFLNNFVPYLSMRDILRFVGPVPTNGSSCYDSADPLAPNWNCSCVIVQQTTSCTLASGAPLFPFGWNQTRSLASSTQLSQFCSSSLFTTPIESEFESFAVELDSAGTVFSNLSNWVGFAEGFCETASTQWQTYPDGRNVRVASDTSGGFVDMALPVSSTSSMASDCSADFNVIQTLPNAPSNLYFQVYTYWISGYQVLGFQNQIFWESQVFGMLPTSTPPLESSFNWRPDIVPTTSEFRMNTVQYAGTGIGVTLPYPVPNPSPTQASSTYPPPPGFTSPPVPNTNKIPVYFISPVMESYAPTISIQLNGGTPSSCTPSGNLSSVQCTIPLETGLNFSTVLSVSLTSAWQNLLPSERYIVGDYSYNLQDEQVVFDVPESMVPLSYNIKALCNTLMYLFQARNSSFVSDTLFNIPDVDFETPISAQNWGDFFQTFYDSECACSSAVGYAKTADAQGQCVAGTNPDGSANTSVPNPGNLDMCVIMEAFKVNVPNYVSAYMTFEPYQYSVQATFQVPKGQVVQYVSTSCPSSFDILKPAGPLGNTEVVFYTNQSSPQKITIQITQFNNSFVCANAAPLTATYTNSTPAVYANIPACGVQYVNVFPYLSNAPCYPYPGLEMYAATSSSNPPVMQSSTLTYVTTVQDSAYENFINALVSFSIANSVRASLATNYNLTSEELTDQLQQINDQEQQVINGINVTGVSEDLQKSTQEQTNKLMIFNNNITNEAIAKAQQEAKQSATILNSLNGTIAQMNEQNDKNQQLAIQMKEQTKKFDVQQAEMSAKVLQLAADATNNNDDGNSCFLSFIPLLGSVLCNLWNGLENVFQIIIGVIAWILIFCLIMMCIKSGCCEAGLGGIAELFSCCCKKDSASAPPSAPVPTKGRHKYKRVFRDVA